MIQQNWRTDMRQRVSL